MNLPYFFENILLTIGFESFKDICECTLIIVGCSMVLSWLSRESTKTLVPCTYIWVGSLIACHYFTLDSLFCLGLFTTPLFILCLAIFHEKSLQKNFVLYKTAHIPRQPHNWLSHLIRSVISSTHKQRRLTCVIERSDSLAPILKYDNYINAPISYLLVDSLIETTKHEPVLYINDSGILVSIVDDISSIKKNLLLTDCIIIQTDPDLRTYTIEQHDTRCSHLNADHALRILQKYCTKDAFKEGLTHARTDVEQPSSYT